MRYLSSFSIRPPSTPTYGVPYDGALITHSLKDYYSQCVFPNFGSLGPSTGSRAAALYRMGNENDIIGAMGAYSELFGDPNIPITLSNSGTGTASCAEALGEIKAAWNGIKTLWLKKIEAKVTGNSSTDPANIGSGTMTIAILARYFPTYTKDYFTMLQNIAAGNLLRDAALEYSSKYGDVNDTAFGLALKSTQSGWVTTAKIFTVIVNTMRNVFEGLIYGLSVLLPVAIALGGLSAIGAYFKILIWLQLWVPFYVILNLYGDYEMA